MYIYIYIYIYMYVCIYIYIRYLTSLLKGFIELLCLNSSGKSVHNLGAR